ncbi:hypothetical protein OK074_8202 [Actinobacteria bacterium OK074]|nr:hypothetical protein OK074_8202 [Actinobacteria bacterium OK074]
MAACGTQPRTRPISPKICRDMVALLLEATGHSQLTDAARLLVSEVVTNVGLHTDSRTVRMEAVVRRDRVRVAVYDDKPGAGPQLKPPEPDAEGGRGLHLLSGLAHEWGVTWADAFQPQGFHGCTGKRVWFELRDRGRSS